ncbi:interferon-induced protein 44-like isoform X3 [Brienomyrus brachyistius]|nr:interferon-induced protein 44-like isoform X3 [Brienomyrus brachyistius]
MGFLLCDTMGLEVNKDGGVKYDDIVSILKGYIPDEYLFNPASPWQPGAGQTELQIKDRIHCVVYVIDSSTLGIMATEMKKKVDEIRKKTSFQDVPLLVLLTHVDRACPHVEKDLKKVYHSCYIKDMIYRASGCLGIRPSNVIPVKNYHDESELNNTCDILLLKAMKQMLDFADNYFDNCQKVGVGKMGSGSSTPVTEENKPELLGKAWRDVVWDHSTRTDLKQYLQDYKPNIDSVPQARILLIGQITAGKSSFFNSINSIFRGNITSQAAVGEMKTSLTLKYHTYQVKAGRGGQPLGFLLCDTMGLEEREDGGMKIEDIESILKGYVPNKYQFNPVRPMKADNSQAWSTLALKDRIHCVVYVIDASTIGIVDQGMKNKIDEIRKRTNSAEVPLLVLLTHVDKACPHVAKDLKKVYHSCYIKDMIYRASECLGILPSNVIPVKNYFDESELSDTCDILLLKAMKQMLDFADNYFDSWEDDTE